MWIWLIMVVNFISFSFLVIEDIFLQAEGTEQVQKEKVKMKEIRITNQANSQVKWEKKEAKTQLEHLTWEESDIKIRGIVWFKRK